MKRFSLQSLLLSISIIFALLALPVGVLADSGSGQNELTQTVNGYQVSLSFDKPVFIGENDIHIRVRDAQNMPISEAELEVSVVEAQAGHVEVPTTAEAAAMPVMTAQPVVETDMPAMNMDGTPTPAAGTMAGMSAEPTSEAGTMAGMNMDGTPTPAAGTMAGMNEEPTSQAGTMAGMSVQPTAEAGTMAGMSDQPTAEAETMAGMSEEPAGHDQMGMVALTAGSESGVYDGQVSIESEGDLTLRLHLTVAGKLTEVDFPLHVTKSNAGVIVLASFFAVNVAIIAGAVVLKPKPGSVNLSKKA